ncbi:MAG: hypothetical protein J5874_05250 [Oscillospiraceae bacterium]|nr:hypothetical protein [Oscillospiraceae bacterium]
MKKIITAIVVIAMLFSVAVLFPAYADNDPIVFGYTAEYKDVAGYPSEDNDSFKTGYDAESDSLKMTPKLSGLGSVYFGSGYENLVVDTTVYKFIKVCYKVNTEKGVPGAENGGQVFAVQFGNTVWSGVRLEWGISDEAASGFKSLVVDMTDKNATIGGVNQVNHEGAIDDWEEFPAIHSAGGTTMSFVIADLGSSALKKTDEVFVKYVAFFATKAEADAFSLGEAPIQEPSEASEVASEASESESEASEAESEASEVASEAESEASEAASEAESEASEPAASAPESSASEPASGSSFPTWAYIVIAAVVVAIIVVIIIAASKSKKK